MLRTILMLTLLGVATTSLSACHPPTPGIEVQEGNEGVQNQGVGSQPEQQSEGTGATESTKTQAHTKDYTGTGPYPPVTGQPAGGKNRADDRMNQ